MNQGTKANYSGLKTEVVCLNMLKTYDFKLVSCKQTDLPSLWVKRNVPFLSIYGHKGNTEFVIGLNKREVRIEIKTQNSSGSVDEKLPYVLLNAIEAYPEKEVIIIVEGDGFKTGAKEWLKNRVEENWLDFASKGKKIYIMSLGEFNDWIYEQLKKAEVE